VNAELIWIQQITGSDCTKRQLHEVEIQGGTTATRRRTETGTTHTMNLMTILDASVTRRTGSRTSHATKAFTTLARKMQVCTMLVSMLITVAASSS